METMREALNVPNVEDRISITLRAIDEEYDEGLRQGFDSDGTADHLRNEFKALVAHGQISTSDAEMLLSDMRNIRKRQGFKGPGNAKPLSEIEYQIWKDAKDAKEQEHVAKIDALLTQLFGGPVLR